MIWTFLAGMGVLAFAMWVMNRFATGFVAQRSADYADGPVIDLATHLNGPLVCEGVLYGPMGRVVSRFVGDFHGRWEGNKGHLVETFQFDSGTEQRREWFLTTHNDGRFEATAADVIGTGSGWMAGSALHLTYRIRLAESAGGHKLDTVDWMYLLDNGTIVNRSQMRKWGFKVAELVATIRKVDR